MKIIFVSLIFLIHLKIFVLASNAVLRAAPRRPARRPRALLTRPHPAAPVRSGVGAEDGRRPRSAWWFALPALFSVLGGVVAYLAIRRDDPAKARNCMWLGLVMTAVSVALNLALAAEFAGIVSGADFAASP